MPISAFKRSTKVPDEGRKEKFKWIRDAIFSFDLINYELVLAEKMASLTHRKLFNHPLKGSDNFGTLLPSK